VVVGRVEGGEGWVEGGVGGVGGEGAGVMVVKVAGREVEEEKMGMGVVGAREMAVVVTEAQGWVVEEGAMVAAGWVAAGWAFLARLVLQGSLACRPACP
jgi:hypothetical protein